MVHRFLNADLHADQVFQTRYGFCLDLKTAIW
jgi:hypothetical protein